MSETSIRFEGLSHAYKPGHWIFREYAASITPGKVLALLGPNGCGKTTLLKILLGALKPTAGLVSIHGRPAFVPQLFQVSFDYSALDMVLMGRSRQVKLFSQPSAKDEKAALAALERFGIASFAARPFHELSGGERQLVILSRALVSEADVLILDEPTSALDLKNQHLILDWIGRLSRDVGLTILLTTHHPHHAMAVADRVLLMMGGSHFVFGPTEETLTEQNLHDLYGVGIKRISFAYAGKTIETLAPVFTKRPGSQT